MSHKPLTRLGPFLIRHIYNVIALPLIGTVNNHRNCSFQTRLITFKTVGLSDDVKPTLDLDYLTDPANYEEIEFNIKSRKGVGCIKSFKDLWAKYTHKEISEAQKGVLWNELLAQGLKIPNRSDPRLGSYGENFKVIEEHGSKPEWSFKPKQFHELAHNLDVLRMENLGTITGQRTYYFLKELSELENSLIRYTLDVLKRKGFTCYSVPDILSPRVIESCGFETKGDRTQVYWLDSRHGEYCLAGTSEMSLAAFHAGQTLKEEELPMKMCAVSRCFRAETGNLAEERGIYRVHQFTKVEMFGLTSGDVAASDALLQEFVEIQKELFSSMGFHYQLLDMPMHELGAPAYRKFDIEAWMPGRNMYGEISSASNCTDYQSRRLGIRSVGSSPGAEPRFVHTVNGTACACPRTLLTIFETNQQADGSIEVPKVLQAYFNNRTRIVKPEQPFKIHFIKTKAQEEKIQALEVFEHQLNEK